MDKRAGFPVPPFYLNRGFHGSGSYGRPFNQGQGPQVPPGFEPESNPRYHSDHMEPPPPGFPHFLKKKRGRPRKSPAPAVGSRGPLDPTAPTTQKNRVSEISDHPDLSKLKPPSRSHGFRTGEELVKLLTSASSVLISGIKEAKNANEMIDLSSKAFAYFDSIGIDYTPVYKAVCSVINHQCNKEALVKQKPHSAFDTKAEHNQAIFELSEAKERHTRVDREVEDAQCDLHAVTAHVKRLEEEIKKGNEKKAKLEAKVADARADKVACQEAYSKAKAKMDNVAPKMGEAQKEIDEFERRWKETMDGLNRAMDETSSFRI